MKNIQELTPKRNHVVQQYYDLLHDVKYLTDSIYCLTILGDNNYAQYRDMAITEQAEKLNELTSQLSTLVKENLEINQKLLEELIRETHEPAISEFLKTLLNVSDRALELNDIIDILLSINVHKLNVGDSRKTSFKLFFSSYSEKYAEQEYSLNVEVTDKKITKIHFK